jgi:hypothetical protein
MRGAAGRAPRHVGDALSNASRVGGARAGAIVSTSGLIAQGDRERLEAAQRRRFAPFQ